jgi:hypothetical protein
MNYARWLQYIEFPAEYVTQIQYKTEYLNLGVHNPAKHSTYLRAYNKYSFNSLLPYFYFLLNPIKLKRSPRDFNKALRCVLDLMLELRLPIETY